MSTLFELKYVCKAVAVEEEPEVVAELPLVKKPKVKFSDPLPVSVEPVKKSKKVVEEEPIRPSNGNKSLKSDGKAAVRTALHSTSQSTGTIVMCMCCIGAYETSI